MQFSLSPIHGWPTLQTSPLTMCVRFNTLYLAYFECKTQGGNLHQTTILAGTEKYHLLDQHENKHRSHMYLTDCSTSVHHSHLGWAHQIGIEVPYWCLIIKGPSISSLTSHTSTLALVHFLNRNSSSFNWGFMVSLSSDNWHASGSKHRVNKSFCYTWFGVLLPPSHVSVHSLTRMQRRAAFCLSYADISGCLLDHLWHLEEGHDTTSHGGTYISLYCQVFMW